MSKVERSSRPQKSIPHGRKPKDFTRRDFMIKGGLATLGTVATASGLIAFAEKTAKKTDEEIILAEAERLGIRSSERERQLWADAYRYTGHQTQVTTENGDITSDRFYDVLERMLHSENPHYKHASDYLLTLREQNRLKFTSLSIEQMNDTSLALVPEAQEGTVIYNFLISPEFMINGSSALTLAGVITHEAKHCENHEVFVNAQPADLTAEQRVAVLVAYLQDLHQLQVEEASGFSADARSYIYETGLLGGTYNTDFSGAEERASHFIQTGSNPTDPRWIEYISQFPGYQAVPTKPAP